MDIFASILRRQADRLQRQLNEARRSKRPYSDYEPRQYDREGGQEGYRRKQ